MKSLALRLIVSTIAGFVTYWIIGVALHVGVSQSLAESVYFRVFGFAPFLAHFFDPYYYFGEGPRFGNSALGDRVYMIVLVGFWTSLFGALYFLFVFRAWKRAHAVQQ